MQMRTWASKVISLLASHLCDEMCGPSLGNALTPDATTPPARERECGKSTQCENSALRTSVDFHC